MIKILCFISWIFLKYVVVIVKTYMRWNKIWWSIKLKFKWHLNIGFFFLVLHIGLFGLFGKFFLGLLLLQYSFLFPLLHFLAISLHLLLNPLAPVLGDLLIDPGFNLNPRHSLHAKYFQCWVIPPTVGIWHSLDCCWVLCPTVLNHWIYRWELLRTTRATEMLCLLMVM